MSTATIQSELARSAAADGLPLVERLDPAPEAVDVFRCLASLAHVVFFDSAMRHPQLGRYSFVAADPVDWIEAPADGSDALSVLQKRVAALPTHSRRDLPPFQGGWAGLFGYELAGGIEAVPAATFDEFQAPALAVGLYDVVLAFDHQEQAAWIVSQGFPETEVGARRERAAARLRQFQELLRREGEGESGRRGDSDAERRLTVSPPLLVSPSPPLPLPPEALAPQFTIPHAPGLTSNFTAEAYPAAIRRVIEYIRAGDVFQVNLAQRLLFPASAPSIDLYRRLRRESPAPFAAYFDAGNWQIASASPERFLRVAGGHVETRPIKGTRRRAASAEDDRLSADALRASSKDRAENVMIVDLLRNDLSRTCRPDSVHVSQLCGLESYASVHHLVSAVEGDLADERTPLDVLRTCFPGGSITGAPKLRAMEIIAELEPTARGAYCGALGYLGPDGQMDTSVLIRTITASRGWWQLPVGGGIVAQSDPENEYAETWDKAESLLRAIRSLR